MLKCYKCGKEGLFEVGYYEGKVYLLCYDCWHKDTPSIIRDKIDKNWQELLERATVNKMKNYKIYSDGNGGYIVEIFNRCDIISIQHKLTGEGYMIKNMITEGYNGHAFMMVYKEETDFNSNEE